MAGDGGGAGSAARSAGGAARGGEDCGGAVRCTRGHRGGGGGTARGRAVTAEATAVPREGARSPRSWRRRRARCARSPAVPRNGRAVTARGARCRAMGARSSAVLGEGERAFANLLPLVVMYRRGGGALFFDTAHSLLSLPDSSEVVEVMLGYRRLSAKVGSSCGPDGEPGNEGASAEDAVLLVWSALDVVLETPGA